jgi:hypothetical protein
MSAHDASQGGASGGFHDAFFYSTSQKDEMLQRRSISQYEKLRAAL